FVDGWHRRIVIRVFDNEDMTSGVPVASSGYSASADSGDRALARLRAAGRVGAAAEAAIAAAMVTVADLCGDREHDSLEVAAIMCWTPRFAGDELSWCRELIESLPAVFAAWRVGDIDRHRARIFVDCLSSLLAEHGDAARAIAAVVLPVAPSLTGPRLRNK